ncbi:MAG: GDP-mannose 4,6-dehydratase [Spirochaetia bacterium]|nr:GDP-mannose 4,6-dehydratase [Spirochaetia bacterium]
MIKKALVIGSAGFVGNYLINCLVDDFNMIVYGTKLENQEYDNHKATIINLNILEKNEIITLLKKIKPDYIFHLAAQSSVSMSWKKPQETVDINIKGAINLFDALREVDYKPRILVIGSGEEYGQIKNNNLPISEETILYPGNIYAATKACQNMIGSIYAKAYGLNIILVRAFNHIGPGQAPIFVVSDFCKQVADIERGLKEPVLYVGNLTAARDFTDVRDIVRAYALLVQKGTPGETYNVGSGKSYTIQAILDKVIKNSKKKIEIKIDSAKFRPIDVAKIEANVKKLKTITGWQPQISIDTTIKSVLDYWRNQI